MGIYDKVIKQLSRVRDTILNPVGSITSAVNNFLPAPVSNAINTGASVIGNAFSSVSSLITGGAKYRGFIPAANGLFGAVASEMARKPSGTDIVIANSSEAILTPAMLRNLVSGSVSVGRSGGNTIQQTFNFTLNNGTPQQIAMEAIQIIEDRLSSELDSRLAM